MFARIALFLVLAGSALAAYTSFCRPCLYHTPKITALAFPDTASAQAHISSTEARVKDLRPAMSKQIIWHGERFEQTRYAIVYIHGFSASKEELRPVPDILAKTFKANLFYTRLAGHGQTPASLGRATIDEWLNDVVESANVGRAIGRKVILVGTSTGASLITWLATQPQYSKDIAAVVFVSPNFGLRSYASWTLRLPFARTLLPLIFGPTRGFAPANAEHAFWWTPDYPTQSLVPMAQAIDLAVAAPVDKITIPAFFVFSPRDRVVDGNATAEEIAKWGAPTGKLVVDTTDNPGNHVPAGHVLSPSTTTMVTDRISQWLATTLQP